MTGEKKYFVKRNVRQLLRALYTTEENNHLSSTSWETRRLGCLEQAIMPLKNPGCHITVHRRALRSLGLEVQVIPLPAHSHVAPLNQF